MFSETSADDAKSLLNSNLAIKANSLSKCYRIYNHPRDRLIQAVWGRDRLGRPKQRYREFWALQKVSFELERGQTLGVVGRNGSGKSTLLQLLCGTLQATTGTVQARGRIGALLELGSGFNPEFSGLDNVFLNASLLGLSQAETEQQLDAILNFAEIGDFIHQPVKTYSSGMTVRLAFAVQAHINPDVLVVDEALAVGDELFQQKCYAHLERLKERGTAVLLVTHSCPQIIQHCNQALLLHNGRLRLLAGPSNVTTTYQRLINQSEAAWDAYFSEIQSKETSKNQEGSNELSNEISNRGDAWFDQLLKPKTEESYPTQGGEILDVWITLEGTKPEKSEQVNHLGFGINFIVHFEYIAHTELRDIAMACTLSSHNGQRLSGQCYPEQAGLTPGKAIAHIPAGSHWNSHFSFRGALWPGLYFIQGGLLSYENGERAFIHRVVDFRAIRVLEKTPMHRIGNCALATCKPEVIGLKDHSQPN